MRVIVKTRVGGADIDGKRLRVQARELGDTYAEFSLTAGLGNATAAIFTSADLNYQTDEATIASWNSITNTEGLALLDINGNGTPEEYYSDWSYGDQSINDFYERTKWIQRRGSSETIYGMSGELFRGITHSFAYDSETGGPFTQNEILTFGNGASATLLAFADEGSSGRMYVQLLTGSAPTNADTITGDGSGATAVINGSVTTRTVNAAFIGASTGSAIIGAYGIGIETDDLTASDQLFDLTNTLQVPPNNVVFTVGGLIAGEDRVLVGPESGGVLNTSQLAADGAQTAGDSSLTVATAIPSDTPASGTVRAFNGDTYDRIEYDSYSGSTFNLTSPLANDVADGAEVFISYIDVLASASTATFTGVYSSDRSLFIRVRDGGGSPIKTFETTGTLGSAGGSTTAIRTTDE